VTKYVLRKDFTQRVSGCRGFDVELEVGKEVNSALRFAPVLLVKRIDRRSVGMTGVGTGILRADSDGAAKAIQITERIAISNALFMTVPDTLASEYPCAATE
jgi:hypothetical protein